MKIIGGALQIHEKIDLQNIDNVYELAPLAEKAKTVKEQNHYLKSIVLNLAKPIKPFLFIFKPRVKKKDFKLINELLKECGLLNKKKDVEIPDDAMREEYNNFISRVAVSLNKTSYEFKKQSTADSLKRDAKETIRRDLGLAENLMKAFHIPKEFSKEITRKLQALKMRAQVDSNVRKICEPIRLINFNEVQQVR